MDFDAQVEALRHRLAARSSEQKAADDAAYRAWARRDTIRGRVQATFWWTLVVVLAAAWSFTMDGEPFAGLY